MKKEKGTQNQDIVKKSPIDVAVEELQEDYNHKIEQLQQEKVGVETKIEDMEVKRLKGLYRLNGFNVLGGLSSLIKKNKLGVALLGGVAGLFTIFLIKPLIGLLLVVVVVAGISILIK